MGEPAVNGAEARSDRGACTKVELITKAPKDDRHDARTLARLARLDPELLGPVRHRSAQAPIHLTVILARAELVDCATGLGERSPRVGEVLWPAAAPVMARSR